jgi:hypothetical protein
MLNQTVIQWDLIFEIKDGRLPSHSVCTAGQSFRLEAADFVIKLAFFPTTTQLLIKLLYRKV